MKKEQLTPQEAFNFLCDTLNVSQKSIRYRTHSDQNDMERLLICYALHKLYQVPIRSKFEMASICAVMDRSKPKVEKMIAQFLELRSYDGAMQRAWQELKLVAYNEKPTFKEHKLLAAMAA